MASIPLNYFKRVSTAATTTPTVVYTAPSSRAGIILSAVATNLSASNQTVTVSVSANGTPNSLYELVKNFSVPANDAVNIAVGKLVLGTADQLIISAGANSSVNFTISVLEAVNTQ
jgi:hypothetical protein